MGAFGVPRRPGGSVDLFAHRRAFSRSLPVFTPRRDRRQAAFKGLNNFRKGANDAPRSSLSLPYPICLGHRLAYSSPRLHSRLGVFHRLSRRRLYADQASHLPRPFAILVADFRCFLRHGSGNRHRDAFSVWDQLEPLFRCFRQCHLPPLGLRGFDGVLSRGDLPRVLLFGRQLVPPVMHFIAAVLVAVGTLSSSFWILATNSWMQTPAGYQLVDGRFFPENWFDIIFNPSFPFRLAHTVSAFYVTTAFVVLGVGAYTLRRGQYLAEGGMMLRLALWFLAIFVPAQMIIGDLHGVNTLAYQPAKLAAMEGLWDGGRGVAASIIGWPDDAAERNLGEVAIPRLWQPLSHPFLGRRSQRPQGLSGRSAPACPCRLFRLSDHGWGRRSDADRRGHGLGADEAGYARPKPPVSAPMPARGEFRLHRGDCRLDHDGGWTAALDRLWFAANGGFKWLLPLSAGTFSFHSCFMSSSIWSSILWGYFSCLGWFGAGWLRETWRCPLPAAGRRRRSRPCLHHLRRR